MDIPEVAEIIRKIAEGFEDACMRCLDENKDVVVTAVTEQLFSGVDGDDQYLQPTYDDDPYFNEPGPWYKCGDLYKAWKRVKTPPEVSPLLGLPKRPEDVPNLYINGKFYSDITAKRVGDAIVLDPGNGDGPDIVAKYGDQILNIGTTAVDYFNITYMLPAIEDFFKQCGYE